MAKCETTLADADQTVLGYSIHEGGVFVNHCRFLNRQAANSLKPGANKRMETVFRPFVCGDPRRDHTLVQELGTSLNAAREECKRRCPAKFGLPATAPEAKGPDHG